MIFDKTPFYAESGGQVSDTGTIISGEFEGEIIGVAKKKDVFFHQVKVIKGIVPSSGTNVELYIDVDKRRDIQRNHTATHILHKVLREKLGSHVEQSGSLVDNDKLRFDFSHFESISRIVLDEIEKEVNDVILSNIPVIIGYENIQTAKDRGAMALFSDKYGDVVRVVEMPGFSIELCGGTHVEFTGEIGLFNVESEGGISSGIRRIVATTGRRSLNYVNDIEEKLSIISSMLKTDENNVVDVVKKYIIESKEILKEKDYLQNKLLKYEMETIFDDVIEISGTKVLIKDFLSKEIDELKEIVDRGKEKLKSGIVVLGSNNGGKAVFIAGVTKDLIGKLKAGDIVKITAQMAGGNGGGRPDFAQAGGKDGSVVKEALLKAKEYIIENLN